MAPLLIFLAYGVGAALDAHFGTNAFRTPGVLLLVFYLPGSLIVSRMRRHLDPVERFLVSLALSACLVPIIPYLAYVGFSIPLTSHHLKFLIIGTLGALTVLNLLIPGGPSLALRRPSLAGLRELSREYRVLIILFALYFAFHIASFLSYPFIPESDGYGLIVTIREILRSGVDTAIGYRPAFPLLSASYVALSANHTVTFFKFVVPLLLSVTVIPPYLLARTLKLRPWQQLVAGLLPLAAPVMFQESEYVRPQSLIILGIMAIVWLLIRFQREKTWPLYWLAAGISVLTVLDHEFSLFLLATCFLTAVPIMAHSLRTDWKRSGLRLAYILLLVFAYRSAIPGMAFAQNILSSMGHALAHPHIQLWFIGNYVNTDGNQLGWPGWSFLLYYGYNLGLAVPVLLVAWAVRHRKPVPAEGLLPAWALFSLAFFFAEITPRFGFAYLPDRAWLYVAISLCFLTVPLIRYLDTRLAGWLAGMASLASGTASVGVTVLKQGWVQDAGYRATLWMRQNTPSDSLVITQVGSAPAIEVYGRRDPISNARFFLDTPAGQQDYLNDASHGAIPELSFFDEKASFEKILSSARQLSGTAAANLPRIQEALGQQVADYVRDKQVSDRSQAARGYKDTYPVYVYFSARKFDSGLYAGRAWWMEANAFGADLDQLGANPRLRTVYDRDGIHIWRYDPSGT